MTMEMSAEAARAIGALQEQLYRYAEDMHELRSEYDELQHKFRVLDQNHRSVLEYRGLISSLIHSIGEGCLSTDEHGIVRDTSRSANLMLASDYPVGRHIAELVAPENRDGFNVMLANSSLPDALQTPTVIKFVQQGGETALVQVRGIATSAADGRRIHWFLRPLADSLPFVEGDAVGDQQARECGGEAVFVTDSTGLLLAVNSAFCRMTGYASADVLGRHLKDVVFDGRGDAFFQIFWEQLTTSGSWQGEISARRRSGEYYPEWLVLNATYGENGAVSGFFAKCHDLSRLQDSEQHLSRLAYYDVLTGIPNRHLFNDRLRMAIGQAKRTGRHLALLFIDLDRFKQVNDSLGHDVGDELLRAIALRLKGAIREVDTVARLGGDEFTIIIPNLQDERDAEYVAGKVLEACQPPVQIGKHVLLAMPSIGIALYPAHGEDAQTLLRRADAAMYHAKADGGNTHRVFQHEDESESQALSLDVAFRFALQRDELYLVYQPQVSANGIDVTGVEALLRWHSPDYGEVSPEVFIPIAEWSGAIVDIGRWVIHKACQQLLVWRQQDLGVSRVAVNISPRQLRDPQFTGMVLDELQAAGLSGGALELEITESELMLYPESTLDKLAELRAHGVKIAIDDFGTGYSNLARLRVLPIDRIKVDRSFVNEIEGDVNAQAISRCIVTLARVMNLEVVAEGVETTGQLSELLRQGCHSIQGYLFARPMPPERLGEWLEQMVFLKEAADAA